MEIIFEDENLIVLNKPAGISVHGGPNVQGPTVVDFLLSHFPDINGVGDPLTSHSTLRVSDPMGSGQVNLRPGIVHRLDKQTSGILVVAKNQKTFETLKSLFKSRNIEKTYLAILCGAPKAREGRISYPIGRMKKDPTKRGALFGRAQIRGEREALTLYRVLKKSAEYSLVRFFPHTGRTHQLRVHAKSIGCPIACDTVYGGKKVCCPLPLSPVQGERPAGRQLLHAESIAFSFPEGRRLKFEADPPTDFAEALKSIDFS